MSRDEIAKLIGGYATGTLTPAEREALFEAALDDQALFDALAREQPLGELLSDPAARAYLLAALGDEPLPWHRRATRWIWGHAVGVTAVACFVAVAGYMATQIRFAGPHVRVVATEPDRVEVTASAPRQFDMSSLKRPAAVPDLPPPAVPRPATGRPSPALLALAVPTVPPPRPAQPADSGRLSSGAPAGGVAGGIGSRPNYTADGVAAGETVAVTASAALVQTASSESAKAIETNAMSNLTLRGRDLLPMLQTAQGVLGNGFLPAEESPSTGARSLFYQGAGLTTGAVAGARPLARAGSGGASQAGPAAVGASGAAAVLTGTVADPGGAAIPNALVQARNTANGGLATVRSSAEGVFRFDGLPPARYELSVSGTAGFRPHVLTNLDLAANETRNVGRISLEVGAVTESVEVSAATMPVQSAKAEARAAAAPPARQSVLAGGMGGGGGRGGSGPAASPAPAIGTVVGRVVDPAGTAVPNARVRIRNVATGASRDTLTNAEGTFVFHSVFPARYDLGIARYRNDLTLVPSAVFQGYVQKNIDLAAPGTRDLGRIALAPRSLTEEAWVTDVRAPAQPGGLERSYNLPLASRDLPLRAAPSSATFGAQPANPVSSARYPGVRYQVLRLLPNGDYETVAADALAKGDTVKLRFASNVAGYLYVAESGGRTLLRTRVESMAEATTPAVKVGNSGRREFLVAFSTQEPANGRYDAATIRSGAATVRSEAAEQERAIYVVGGAPAGQTSFVIALDFK